jgi:urease accessory protein
MRLKPFILAAVLAVTATPTLAHTGTHPISGFAAGFLHPVGGLDHMLAMVGVGLFAAILGRSALVALPASFVLMMMAGGVMGMVGLNVPAVELAVAASVVAMGAVVALGWSWSVSAAAVLVGFFALFHGYAHGAEIPSEAAALPYGMGFALTSAALHAIGIFLNRMVLGDGKATRALGAAIAIAGLMLAFGKS